MKTPQEFFTIYKQSAWTKDTESMTALYHDDVVIFDMWQHGYQKGLTHWSVSINNWLGSLGEEKVNVNFEMIEVHEGGNAAFGNAVITYQAITQDSKILRSMRNRITVGFLRQNDGWKVAHQHTSSPINSELKAILDFKET
jgi:ketosteroid isomerase-like protein